jgi:hypothetical protein
MAFISTLYHSAQLRALNKSGVTTSLAHLTRFLIPGILSGILSAILTAINQGNDGSHQSLNILHYKKPSSMAGLQLAGIGLSLAIGIVAGLLIGVLYLVINGNARENQFDDREIYTPDFPDAIHNS